MVLYADTTVVAPRAMQNNKAQAPCCVFSISTFFRTYSSPEQSFIVIFRKRVECGSWLLTVRMH